MPLLDHFHGPLGTDHHWVSFHATWATEIMASLNRLLPARYLAEVNIHLGTRVEADVAEFERERAFAAEEPYEANGPGVVALATYAPPAVTATVPAIFPDDIEVRVVDRRDGLTLVAVVELVSPANKDRPESRRGFTAKCVAYLQRGVGLIVVDVVTTRQSDLFADLLEMLGQKEAVRLPEGTWLHAAAYRPVNRQDANLLDIWLSPLAVGQRLPTTPLALRRSGCVPVDLEATYTEARVRNRL